MGTGLGSKAVVEVTKEKSVRVDGVIIDSPFHSFEYALEKMPNFYYYSSFFIDWSKFLEVAGLKVHTANVSSIIACLYICLHELWIILYSVVNMTEKSRCCQLDLGQIFSMIGTIYSKSS